MKKYVLARMRLSVLVIVGALGTFALAMPHLVKAQSAPEKIRKNIKNTLPKTKYISKQLKYK